MKDFLKYYSIKETYIYFNLKKILPCIKKSPFLTYRIKGIPHIIRVLKIGWKLLFNFAIELCVTKKERKINIKRRKKW